MGPSPTPAQKPWCHVFWGWSGSQWEAPITGYLKDEGLAPVFLEQAGQLAGTSILNLYCVWPLSSVVYE